MGRTSSVHKTIRVLHIIGDVCGGGVETVVMNYYRHIDRSAVQFDFVIHRDGKPLLDDEIKSLGGRVYKVDSYRSNLFKHIYQIKKIVQENEYKIVHSHMNTLAVFSLFAAWWGGASVRIVHNHTTTDKKEKIRSFLKYALRPFSKTFANQYIACSKISGEWMFGKTFCSRYVWILKNAIDIEKFLYNKKKRNETRKKFGISENSFVIGHVGRFVPVKNHLFLLEILKSLITRNKDVYLILVGDGPLMEYIVSEVKNKNLDGYVRLLGLRDDVTSIYSAMDVFVLPSWYEGLPVVSVEAQANGLPCIISNRVSDECRLTSAVSFLSLENSAESWANKIWSCSKERNRFAQEEIKVAGYDITQEAKRLEEFYKKHSNYV